MKNLSYIFCAICTTLLLAAFLTWNNERLSKIEKKQQSLAEKVDILMSNVMRNDLTLANSINNFYRQYEQEKTNYWKIGPSRTNESKIQLTR